MISFRLTDSEYAELSKFCEERGVRSMSDLARYAMKRLTKANGAGGPSVVEERLDALHNRVAELDRLVELLAQRVDPAVLSAKQAQ